MFKQIVSMVFAVVLSFSVMAQDQASGDERIAVHVSPIGPLKITRSLHPKHYKALSLSCKNVIGRICGATRTPAGIEPRPLHSQQKLRPELGLTTWLCSQFKPRQGSNRFSGTSPSYIGNLDNRHKSPSCAYERRVCLKVAAIIKSESSQFPYRSQREVASN